MAAPAQIVGVTEVRQRVIELEMQLEEKEQQLQTVRGFGCGERNIVREG